MVIDLLCVSSDTSTRLRHLAHDMSTSIGLYIEYHLIVRTRNFQESIKILFEIKI